MTKPRSIDKLTVVEAYPGAWSVDAEGITITADTAADAVAIVQRALLGEQAHPMSAGPNDHRPPTRGDA